MTNTDHDLDLAVELINTYWVLASPPDRLTDTGVYQRILRNAGDHALAGQLAPGDLAAGQVLPIGTPMAPASRPIAEIEVSTIATV